MSTEAFCCVNSAVTSSADHPLDQLTPQEVNRASAAVRRYAAAAGVPGSLRFNTVLLQEPPKAALLAYEAGNGPRPARVARVWVTNPPVGHLFEAHVVLSEGLGSAAAAGSKDVVTGWTHLPHVQPTTTPDDNMLAESIIMADSRIQQLLSERYGITDPELIVFDPWSLNGTPEEFKGRRLMQGFLYVRSCKADNEYAHPLDLCPLVDLNLGKVIHVDMYDAPARMPPLMVNYHKDLAKATTGQEWRSDLQAINITQPQGPSFAVEGNLVRWTKWNIRVGFNAREGLVLHNVGYEDGGRLRPVLHRASLAEMAVPYGQPDYPYIRKCAFDVGDYGMGFVANSLQLGCDCLGHIKYFDGVVNNAQGEGMVIPNAICLHEEDAGLLWKHTDTRLGHVEVRRNRRLVISMLSTFANYEYGMFWYFYLDGTIQLEMKLTGILSTSVMNLGDRSSQHGIVVAPGVLASNHQHLFCVRIDPAVDDEQGGKSLVVAEVNAEQLPWGPDNPHGNAFRVSETPLLSVHAAMRMAAPEKARAWKIKNPGVINPITGQPVSFKLIPTTNVPMLMQHDSLVGKRAFFATKHLFVTPHEDNQLFPSGDHVVQSEECLGLKQWTKEDRSLVDADPVIWYSFGVTHLPRLEDFPIMPVETVGFMLKPYGFFTWNPTLDLPPDTNKASKQYEDPQPRAKKKALLAAAAAAAAPAARPRL